MSKDDHDSDRSAMSQDELSEIERERFTEREVGTTAKPGTTRKDIPEPTHPTEPRKER